MYKVIIVDDNINEREGLRDLIGWNLIDCEVIALAENGKEGLEYVKRLKPDIIITDVSMPVMNGIEMAQEMVKSFKDCSIIFISCYEEFDYVKSAMDMAASAYILKPIKPEEMEETIKLSLYQLEQTRKDKLLREHFNNDLPILREQFMRELLYGVSSDHKENLKQMELLGVDTAGWFVVFETKIDYYEVVSEREIKEYKYYLIYNVKRCIEDLIPLNASVFSVVLQKDLLAIVLVLKEREQHEAMNRTVEIINEINDFVKKEYDISLTFGVGGLSKSIEDISGFFDKAEYALKSKFYTEGNGILLADEIVPKDANINFDIEQIRSKIEAIIDNDTSMCVEEFLEEFFGQNCTMHEIYAKSLCMIIFNVLDNVLRQRGSSFKNIFNDETIVWNKLYQFETILDIKQWISNMIEAVKESLINFDSDMRYRRIVMDVKEIIDRDYGKIENVSYLSDEVNVSPNYLHHLFKKYAGQTILEYLTTKRVEEAKKLLGDPYCRIYEVAEKVGYKNTNYFTSVFKGVVGMTPSEFRKIYVDK